MWEGWSEVARSCLELSGHTRIPRAYQELTGVARKCNRLSGVARMPGVLWKCASRCMDVPGVVRECQKESGGARMFQGLSGVVSTS